MGLYEDKENGSKNDKRKGMVLKSKVIEDSEAEEESDSDEEKMAMYARRFRRFIKKNKPWKKYRNQLSRDERTPKKTVKSFVIIATSLVMLNKTANFPKRIQSM